MEGIIQQIATQNRASVISSKRELNEFISEAKKQEHGTERVLFVVADGLLKAIKNTREAATTASLVTKNNKKSV